MSPYSATDQPSPIDVDVWIALDDSDCFAAKERIETAIGRFERPHEVTVRFHTLEPGSVDHVSTFDARRLCALALTMGGPALQSALVERLSVALFREQAQIDDPTTLLRLAAEAGLDERRVASVLAGTGYTEEVHADEATAAEQGITRVPCVVAGRAMLSGPGMIDEYLTLLREAGGLADFDEPSRSTPDSGRGLTPGQRDSLPNTL